MADIDQMKLALAEQDMRKLYHGTPHRFPPTEKNPLGEFDPTKIGSGEGAQAYGHGHYLAEAVDTAKSYAKNLANRDMANQGRLNAHANAQRLASLMGDPKYAADDIQFVLENEPEHPQKELLQKTLEFLKSGEYSKPLENKGHLYHIHVPHEHIERMLDWDKPLSEQHPDVQKTLIDIANSEDEYSPAHKAIMRGDEGRRIYKALHGSMPPSAASQTLREWDVPGIKYLDANSRDSREGTRNLVIFPGNEHLMKIVHREKKGGVIHKADGGRTSIVPMPNRWFIHPDKNPHYQDLVEKVLRANGVRREDMTSGAYVDPKTGLILDRQIMNDVNVKVNPRPSMSGLATGLEQLPQKGLQTKSNLVRKSLYKPIGGDPMLRALDFIATIERSGAGHRYGLETQYLTPAELFNTGKTGNPTLRPKSKGDLFGVGDVVGRIKMPKGMEHDVYEKLVVAPKGSDYPGKRLHKADGGEVSSMVKMPNGKLKPAHPTEEGIRNFKESFGNTKVRDSNNSPLVMYTGTSKDTDFSKFKIPKNGAWFTDSSQAASEYAKENDSKNIKYDFNSGKYEEVNTASRVIPAYLNIKNPAKLSDEDMQAMRRATNYRKVQGQIFDRLRSAGHDGVDMGDGVWVVIKHPTQIKSAIGNTGKFNLNDPDITKKKGGKVNFDAMRYALANRAKAK